MVEEVSMSHLALVGEATEEGGGSHLPQHGKCDAGRKEREET